VAQLVVRNVENGIKARLQRRAKRNGRSMEEVRDILRNAVNEPNLPTRGLGTEISALFVKAGLDSDISEMRGHEIKPASFDE
jgi:plasmid stability protein